MIRDSKQQDDLVFMSPMKVDKRPDNRVSKVSMQLITAVTGNVMTLSYKTAAIAKANRKALLASGNVYAVPSMVLWQAIAQALQSMLPVE